MQRIHIRDVQRVTHQASCRRTASGTNRNSLRFRVMNEIPNDQEVARKAHLLNHFDFIGEPRLILRQRMAQPVFFDEPLDLRPTRLKAFANRFLKIRIGGVAFGHFEIREGIVHALNLDVAAFRNRNRAGNGVRQFAENLRHLLRGLEIKLVGSEFHALAIAHGFPGLYAHQDFLSVRIRLG